MWERPQPEEDELWESAAQMLDELHYHEIEVATSLQYLRCPPMQSDEMSD